MVEPQGKRMRPDNFESEEKEELRHKVDDLEKQLAEKRKENGKLRDVLTEARKHIRAKVDESKDLKQLEAVKELVKELEAVKEEMELRMKENLDKIENLDAKVTTLSSQNQMEESRNEKLKTENRRLQENVETAHETIVKNLDKIANLWGKIGAKEQEMADKEKEMTEKEQDIAKLEAKICDEEKEITRLQENVETAHVKNLSKICEKDNKIANLEAKIGAKEQEMAKKERKMIEKEKEIANKDNEITELHQTIVKNISKICKMDNELFKAEEKYARMKEETLRKEEETEAKQSKIEKLEKTLEEKETLTSRLLEQIDDLKKEQRLKSLSPDADLEAKQSKIGKLEKTLEEKEIFLSQLESRLADCECSFKIMEQQKEMKACYAELDKKDKCLESLNQTLKETELVKSDMKKKYDDFMLERQTEIQSKEIEIQSLKIEKNTASILENKLKNDLNEMQMAAELLKKTVITLGTSDKKQQSVIANLKEIVTGKEEKVANLVAVIEEHGCLKSVENGGGDEIDRELALFEKIAAATGESLEQVCRMPDLERKELAVALGFTSDLDDLEAQLASERQRLKESKAQIQAEKNRMRCSICMDKEVEIFFQPCGHISCCQDCSTKVKKCPNCRGKITKRLRAFHDN